VTLGNINDRDLRRLLYKTVRPPRLCTHILTILESESFNSGLVDLWLMSHRFMSDDIPEAERCLRALAEHVIEDLLNDV